VKGKGKKADIDARVAEIRGQIEKTKSTYDREKLEERLARLTGGVAVLNVGAATETELKERKGRVEDALAATRAAIEEGVVVGGGVALLRTIEAAELVKLKGDEKLGRQVVVNALSMPARQIAENAGEDGPVVVDKIRSQKGNYGFNAQTRVYEDLFKAGVLDPTKVTRSALQHATSIAGMILTTETLITEKPEKKDDEKDD
jgi:chaperonin GroEL